MKYLPQLIYLVLIFIALLIGANRHNGTRLVNDNFFIDVMCVVIQFGLLWWGGFFDVFYK